MRSKPLFRWTHAAFPVRERMDLAVMIQQFFFRITEARLSPDEARTAYAAEFTILKKTMMEVGVAVDGPAWFKDLLS